MLDAVAPPEPADAAAAVPEAVLVLRTDHLPPDLSSAARARRVVREALLEADRPQWLEACELATTEVVSNAVLHAHTDCWLTVAVSAGTVRVEVRDASPVLPVQRDYSEQASTGRGLALVAALTDDHGLVDVGPGGKTVWFTVTGDPAEQSEEELLDAWADADWDLGELLDRPVVAEATTTVQLLGLPPTLWMAARQHHDAILRELVLHLAERDGAEVDVVATDRARAAISTAVVAALEHARGTATARSSAGELDVRLPPVDLALEVPVDLGPAYAAMQDTLDVAERLARAGRLLVHPGLPEVVAVRDWACQQVTAQLAGIAPSPWPGADQERFTTAVHDRDTGPDTGDEHVAAVRDSARCVVAADEANRIVAVSRPLAELVGWSVDELVGRRVVTLVPPQLREAHVAGFVRHLATGEAHIIGVPLTVPVLHADGRQLTCRLLVEHLRRPGGRATYLAWLDALT